MGGGDGGSLLYSGPATGVTASPFGIILNLPEYRIVGNVAGIVLGPGTYSVSPFVAKDCVGNPYVTTTGGLNGIGTPLGGGRALVHNPAAGLVYASTTYGAAVHDFSCGSSRRQLPNPARSPR